MQHISAAAWSEFEELFPEAAAYLNRAELEGELKYLRNVFQPSPWQQARLAELEHHKAVCDLLRAAQSMPVIEYLTALDKLQKGT